LVQGTATLHDPDPAYPTRHRTQWERAVGHISDGPVWGRWLRVYHARVEIEIAVERVVSWPDLLCSARPTPSGAVAELAAPPQRAPRHGTAPRVDARRAAARVEALPHRLLGWVGADGLPVVVPVAVRGVAPEGLLLDAPDGLVPAGGRRAGLTAHAFTRHVLGQQQRIYTGWMEADPARGTVVYAPHTETGHRLPPSRLVYNLAVGYATRRWQRDARKAARASR
jgi:hypothetical protein